MIVCPYCKNEVKFVICVSSFYQRQLLDKEGKLSDTWEDMDDAIGDTTGYFCPECDSPLEFDRNNEFRLVEGLG